MRFSSALRSRDPQAAAHSLRLILLVSAVAVSGLTLFQQVGAAGPIVLTVHWAGVATLLAGAVTCTVVAPARLDRLRIGAVIATGGVMLICTLNLLTADTSLQKILFLFCHRRLS